MDLSASSIETLQIQIHYYESMQVQLESCLRIPMLGPLMLCHLMILHYRRTNLLVSASFLNRQLGLVSINHLDLLMIPKRILSYKLHRISYQSLLASVIILMPSMVLIVAYLCHKPVVVDLSSDQRLCHLLLYSSMF